jgi:hypothetical protein
MYSKLSFILCSLYLFIILVLIIEDNYVLYSHLGGHLCLLQDAMGYTIQIAYNQTAIHIGPFPHLRPPS